MLVALSEYSRLISPDIEAALLPFASHKSIPSLTHSAKSWSALGKKETSNSLDPINCFFICDSFRIVFELTLFLFITIIILASLLKSRMWSTINLSRNKEKISSWPIRKIFSARLINYDCKDEFSAKSNTPPSITICENLS